MKAKLTTAAPTCSSNTTHKWAYEKSSESTDFKLVEAERICTQCGVVQRPILQPGTTRRRWVTVTRPRRNPPTTSGAAEKKAPDRVRLGDLLPTATREAARALDEDDVVISNLCLAIEGIRVLYLEGYKDAADAIAQLLAKG